MSSEVSKKCIMWQASSLARKSNGAALLKTRVAQQQIGVAAIMKKQRNGGINGMSRNGV
jgi:hypothetical protein